MCAFFQLLLFENYTSMFRPLLRHKTSCSFSPSPSSHLLLPSSLSMASYGGELLRDSSSPWSGISNHFSSISIPLPLILKKQRTPLMKKIQGLQASHGATSCGIRAFSSRWCSFASSVFLFGQLTLIPCYSSYSPCISFHV